MSSSSLLSAARGVLCTAGLLVVSASHAGDWSSFRGPNGSGVVESAVPARLDLESNLRWKAPLYPGYSSPVVHGDTVVLTAYEDVRLFTVCLDRDTGRTRWTVNGPKPIEQKRLRWPNSPVSSTPAVDDERIYVVFENFGVVAYDHEGVEQWQRDIGPFSIPHGMSTSPVLYGDTVILLCDQDDESFLIALDRATGETVWRTERPGKPHGYATPALRHTADGDAEIIVPGAYQLCGYEAGTGALLWWVDGMAWQAKAVPVIDDDRVYVNASMVAATEFGAPRFAGTWAEELDRHDADDDKLISLDDWEDDGLKMLWFLYDMNKDDVMDEAEWEHARSMSSALGGLFAIDLGGRGDITDANVAWTYTKRRGLPDIPSPLLYDGVLYLIKSGGILTAMDPATGEIHKQERVAEEPSDYFASPIAADGRIVVAAKDGIVSIVKAGPEWETLSTIDLGEELWASPALAGGRVYVRTEDALYCFEGAAAEAADAEAAQDAAGE